MQKLMPYDVFYIPNILLIFHVHAELSKVLMPPKLRKQGRPKGAEKTIIGLPKKMFRIDKPLPFLRKPPRKKEKG